MLKYIKEKNCYLLDKIENIFGHFNTFSYDIHDMETEFFQDFHKSKKKNCIIT